MKDEIILFESDDKAIILPVQVSDDTVWLNRNQLAELFGRDIKTIGKHIGNALREELEPSTVAKFATVQNEGERTKMGRGDRAPSHPEHRHNKEENR